VLHMSIEELGESVILRCTGRIVSGHESALLCSAVGQYGRNVILDLTNVETIDAAGVGALISLQAAGIYLQLLDPNKALREVLRVTRLDRVFEIRNSPPPRIDGKDPLLDQSAGQYDPDFGKDRFPVQCPSGPRRRNVESQLR
jgi:anti-anti-sigma factor